MSTNFGGKYSTGTVALTHNGTAVVGTGVMWQDIEQGDLLCAQGFVAPIDTCDGDDDIVLMTPWAGTTASGVSYVIVKNSALRYEPALTQAKARAFLQILEGAGIIYYVIDPATAPDPGIGEDGQFALKADSAAWKLWLKISGSWILQGTPVGAAWKGLWNPATAYILNDAVSRNSKAYIAINPSTNKPPESEPTFWDIFVSNGGRYDVPFYAVDRPASSEKFAMVFTTTVVFAAGLIESVAKSAVAATASAVFSIQKNSVEFATFTFAIGGTVGTFVCVSDITLLSGDVLSIIAPSSRDATLADITATITGYR